MGKWKVENIIIDLLEDSSVCNLIECLGFWSLELQEFAMLLLISCWIDD